MKPTEQLEEEHLVILRMFSALEKQIDFSKMGKVVEFFQVFADKCHHGKEEKLLFPELQNVKLPNLVSLKVLIAEHQIGRTYILEMKKALENKNTLDFNRYLKKYENLLSFHIKKENKIMFPLVDKALSEKTQKELEEGFEKIEHEIIGEGKHEKFERLINQFKNS